MRELSLSNQLAISAGEMPKAVACFGAGILTGAAIVTGNWWAVAGLVLGAYGNGCFC